MEPSDLERQYNQDKKMTSADIVAQEMQDIKDWKKEVFAVFCLDSANHVISREIISIGILDSAIIHSREIYRTAIIRNAKSIIISHNHPSGNIEPSDNDIAITKSIGRAGDIIGITLLDHVIVGKDKYYSFVEHCKKDWF